MRLGAEVYAPAMTRDRVERALETRILIDRPIEAVWKRIQDLARLADTIDGVQVRDASPTGDTVALAGFVTVAPYRLRFAGHAAVLDVDDLTHRATIAIDVRDQHGRGRLTATTRVALRPVGSGVEMVVHIDARLAGAIVRGTDDALLLNLDPFVHAVFVAVAGDAFAVDDTDDALFETPMFETDLDQVSVEDDADEGADDEDDVDDDEAEEIRNSDDLDPDDDLVLVVEPERLDDLLPRHPSFADPVIAAIVDPDRRVSAPVAPSTQPTQSTPPIPLDASNAAPRTVGRESVGLPAQSLPRSRGLRRVQSRTQRVTQTAGTVAATAAVAAVVAGAFVARRWFGRR